VLDELKLKAHMMPQDVTTCWNSTYDMLKFALEYQEALDTITGKKDMKLHKYEMDNGEWVIAHQLHKVLKVSLDFVSGYSFHLQHLNVIYHWQVFKDAILFSLQDKILNLATVIPAMDYIEDVLTTNATDKQFSAPIQAALAMGKQTLNRYYSKLALSDVYQIAMGAKHLQ
jgi:hypothetical protein